MARGYTTTRLPHIPLSQGEIAVHPAARPAYAYFRRHIANRHMTPDASRRRPPLLVVTGGHKKPVLVGGFDQLALIPEHTKVECMVWDQGELSDDEIFDGAWEYVGAFISLRLIGPLAIASQIHALQESFPESLIGSTLATDPKHTNGTELTVESLCRAYRISSDSVRGHMPKARSGGISTHSYATDITKEKKKDD